MAKQPVPNPNVDTAIDSVANTEAAEKVDPTVASDPAKADSEDAFEKALAEASGNVSENAQFVDVPVDLEDTPEDPTDNLDEVVEEPKQEKSDLAAKAEAAAKACEEAKEAALAAELEAEERDTAPVAEDEFVVPRKAGTATGDEIELDGKGPKNERSGFMPWHNKKGHRCAFINSHGEVTVMDDETAEMLFENPKFYHYTYDSGSKNAVAVSTLRWCDRNGNEVGGLVGEKYELGK